MTTVCLTFDFDALSIWISTFKQVTPTALSRGEYGPRVGIPRILDVLAARHVPATFFVPAHTASSFPGAVKLIVSQGHEIGAHGYVHESPVGLSKAEEADLLVRSEEILERSAGVRPRGYRSPAWDLSENTIELLEDRGYIYDSSMMADDFSTFHPRKKDVIDVHGFTAGTESSLIEFPVAWELDDYPYFHFASRPINQGLRSVGEVRAAWQAEFDYCHTHVSDGVFNLTMHPEIIGRGPRVQMLDSLIAYMQSTADVVFSTLGNCADRLRARVAPH